MQYATLDLTHIFDLTMVFDKSMHMVIHAFNKIQNTSGKIKPMQHLEYPLDIQGWKCIGKIKIGGNFIALLSKVIAIYSANCVNYNNIICKVPARYEAFLTSSSSRSNNGHERAADSFADNFVVRVFARERPSLISPAGNTSLVGLISFLGNAALDKVIEGFESDGVGGVKC